MTQLSEVFLAGGTVEKEDNILWKTCLIPGRIELTPGGGGRKLDKPLIFVEGNATNDEEIGLQDIYEAFEDRAIQNVTVPLTHKNLLLENTGFARKMRWAEENGKKVLQAGFEILDPEVAEKVELGTIADVSCGILRNYRKQRNGKTYKSAVEHIALTNYPWVDGMGAFTKLSADDDIEEIPVDGFYFSEQQERVDLAYVSKNRDDSAIVTKAWVKRHMQESFQSHVADFHNPNPVLTAAEKKKLASKRRKNGAPKLPAKGTAGSFETTGGKGVPARPYHKTKLSEASDNRLARLNLAINHETDSGNMFDYTAKGVEDITNIGRIVHWDDKNSLVLRQHMLEDELDTTCPDCLLVDFTVGKALLQDENGQHWVAGYSINEDGDVELHPRDEWTAFDPEDINN